jgi:hypothetical protein
MLRRLIAVTAWVFVVAMVVNTMIALRYGWPAEFDAPGNPDTITTDFILHGTRISPPVHALLILATAGWFALYRGWRGVVATLALVAFSLLVTIAAAGEPAGLPQNDVPRFAWLILGVIGRYAPLLLILLGLAELVRRVLRRARSKQASTTG